MTIVEVSVSVDCAECESKIRNALLKKRGVYQVEVDRINHKVRVTGSIDQKNILKAIRKTGKRATLSPHTYNPMNNAFHPEYYRQYQAVPAHRKVFTGKANTYNYHVHGYDSNQLPGYYHSATTTQLVNDKAHYLFSDDNPTACLIM